MAAYRGTAPENERWWTTPKHNRNQVTTGGVWIGAIAATDDFEGCPSACSLCLLLALPFNEAVFGRMVFRRMTQCVVALPVLMLVVASGGCGGGEDTLFERLPAGRTGIDFTNRIVENDSLLNPLDFSYVYNGAGVGVGDFDGDGRPDLYFAGNVVDNALYLNRGDVEFEDVTEAAGATAEGAWSTGVATVDINQDGRMDIYVCVAGPDADARGNRLLINQGTGEEGVPRFREAAAEYSLADTGYSTQAPFFDYDQDGDLDLYLLTNSIDQGNRNAPRPIKTKGQAPSTDRLYRNEGDGTFTNVSEEAGIQTEGFGLGVNVSDINQDGWPDIYVANDFLSNDLLWINQGDGTFENRLSEATKHQSHSGMGNDVADFNNDGRPDIAVVDMLPPRNERQKLMLPGRTYSVFHAGLRRGYEPQYVRNTLQLNRGRPPDGGGPAFSEIGQLAGVEKTDWSWAPLFADFNNDGRKDLFISNGYGKDVTNLDHIKQRQQASAFGTPEANRKQAIEAMKELDEVTLQNYLFRNDGDLTFTDVSEAWGMGPPSLSNGTAYVDIDSDGDLDLVTNNIDDEAFVLKNRARERAQGTEESNARYLRVKLDGPPGNRAGYGAKVVLQQSGGRTQYVDHSPYRGYKSTVGRTLHFGLGTARAVDSLTVYWPDGRQQLLTDVRANQTLTLRHGEAAADPPQDRPAAPLFEQPRRPRLFQEAAQEHGLTYEHTEHTVVGFKETPLLPHQFSRYGPGVAVGDADGDGRADVYLGGDRGQRRTLFMQRPDGRFARQALPVDGTPVADTRHEDMGALFFDADGDGDRDLYVVSGGNAAPAGSPAYQDRLYLNRGGGDGRFRRAGKDALPELTTSGSCVRAADYDGDGDLDLFVGGRLVPGRYPLSPRSYVLRNDSEGGTVHFTDVTKKVAPGVAKTGMVTDALWTDFTGDGRVDLLLAGEWMPLTFFKNEGGRFTNVTDETGLPPTAGWWNSLVAGDFDRDGDTDYVAGNLGLNNKYDASAEKPVRIYAKDFNDNGTVDPIITRYIDGTEVPDASANPLFDQIAGMKGRFPTYQAYADAVFDDMFTDEELKGAYKARAVRFATSYLENKGDSRFEMRRLPMRTQFAPTYGMRAADYNADGHLDLLAVGNSYAPDPQTGRYDASVGSFLAGDGTGRFERVDDTESGFWVDGDAEGLAHVQTGRQSLVLATQNKDSLRVFAASPSGSASSQKRLSPRPLDAYATLHFANGTTRRHEFFYGSTYLSQSSRTLRVPQAVEEVVVYDSQGDRRTLTFETEITAR